MPSCAMQKQCYLEQERTSDSRLALWSASMVIDPDLGQKRCAV
jgi:hypothetical protein